MSNYTPGPWVIREYPHYGFDEPKRRYVIFGGADGENGVAGYNDILNEADARLIAAAPEMKDLLAEVALAIWNMGKYRDFEEKCKLIDSIDTLLSRIEGEDSE